MSIAMHELSIATSLIAMAAAEARRRRASRVHRLRCRIGTLRQVDKELLHEAFSIAAADSPCKSASLDIETVELTAHCPGCGTRFTVRNWDCTCPTCHIEGTDIAGGDELELVSIDLDIDDATIGNEIALNDTRETSNDYCNAKN